MTAPDLPAEWVTAAAEAIEDAAIPRIGRDLGTIHRDDIVEAGLRAVVPLIVESIAAGFDARATAAALLTREMAREDRDVDVVLAHQSAARFVRSHAGNRFPSVAAAVSGPGGTPGARCPSRIAHESGAVIRCDGPVGHAGLHAPIDARRIPDGWADDDDRVITTPTPDDIPGHAHEYTVTFDGDTYWLVHDWCDYPATVVEAGDSLEEKLTKVRDHNRTCTATSPTGDPTDA